MSEDLEAYIQANEEQARILHEDSINELRSCAAKPGRNKERYYRDLCRDWSSVARGDNVLAVIREAAALDGVQLRMK